jgi:hypothetical protein
VLAQPAAHLGAGDVGQHQVQHHHVRAGIGQRGGQGGLAGVGDRHLVALAGQAVLQGGRQIDLVLDDEHATMHGRLVACGQ